MSDELDLESDIKSLLSLTKTELVVFIISGPIISSIVTFIIFLNKRGIELHSLGNLLDSTITMLNDFVYIPEDTEIPSTPIYFVLGLAVYILLWLSLIFFTAIRNDAVIFRFFTFPNNSNKTQYLVSIVARFLIRILAFVLLLFISREAILKFFKITIESLYREGFYSYGNLSFIMYWIVNVLSVFTIMYSMTICIRLLFLKRRVF